MLVASYNTTADIVTFHGSVKGNHRWWIKGKNVITYEDDTEAVDSLSIRFPTKGTCNISDGLDAASQAFRSSFDGHEKPIKATFSEFSIYRI